MDFESAPRPMLGTAGFNSLRISPIIVPTETALFLDSGEEEPTISEFQPPYSGQPKAYATEFSGRHNGSGNILFAAGNAGSFSGRAVVDTNPNSPRRGGGIFPPAPVIWRHDPVLLP